MLLKRENELHKIIQQSWFDPRKSVNNRSRVKRTLGVILFLKFWRETGVLAGNSNTLADFARLGRIIGLIFINYHGSDLNRTTRYLDI